MMRKFIWIFIALCNVAMAQSPPGVIGTIRNKGNGEITLTGEECSAKTGKYFVYIRDPGGRISLTGCWSMLENNIFVAWADGDVYSYPIESLTFTPEFDAWYEKSRGGKKYQ